MKGPLSALATLLTVLALIAGAWGQGHAQARPRAAELLAVDLCAEGARAVVLLDARGRPVAPEDCGPLLCPDCIPVPPLAVAGGPAGLAAAAAAAAAPTLRDLIVRAGHPHPARPPRGPPDTI